MARAGLEVPHVLVRTAAFPKPDIAAGGRTAYSTSKLAVIYLVHAYARRLPAGIDLVAYHPGFVAGTGLARDAGPVPRFAMRRILPARALTPLATGRGVSGRCLADGLLGRTHAPPGSYANRSQADRLSREFSDRSARRTLGGR
ncbi:hypothetical protein [Streptomyces sp. A0642]|uniref:hypothetical protein n=1 Tax=Streptomyces sp. A0642 TaxID=2563100 RepID=UPI0019D1DC7C|nr:hypothetical protein [Streptomyces sp. A0642]